MIKYRLLFAMLLASSILSPATADANSDYQEYQVYTNSNGDIILHIPAKFVPIAAEIFIPLMVTPKNGVFKLVQNGANWSLVTLTQSEFDSLSLTPSTDYELTFKDIDDDGVIDLVLRSESALNDSFVINQLQDTAKLSTYSIARNNIDLSQDSNLLFTDLNGDGLTDIITNSQSYLGSKSGDLINTSPLDAFSNPGNIVGLSAGQFKVSEAGAATYTMPLSLPPAAAGVAPQVALSYNSQSGQGILGMGWSLSGLAGITRCPKNIAIDGVIKGIQFDDTDAYCLNGQRLVLNAGSSNQYHTEIDGFSAITAYTGTHGPDYFSVTTQANEIHYYGKAPLISGDDDDAYVERGGFELGTEARIWALKAIVDHKGNYIRYDYNKDTSLGNHYLSSIQYGGNYLLSQAPYNSIEFNYQDSSSPLTGYANGGTLLSDKSLKNIIVKQDSDVFRHYQFTWQLASIPEERDYITGIQECFDTDATHCLPATSFEYANLPEQATSITYEWCEVAQDETETCSVVDWCSNTGKQGLDYCQVTYDDTLYNPFDSSSSSIASSSADRHYAQILDFNGDGLADVLYPKNGSWYFYTQEWERTTANLPTSSPASQYHANYLSSENISRQIASNTFSSKSAVVSDSKTGEKGYAQIIDYNGDSKQDLLVPYNNTWHVITADPYTSTEEDCQGEPDGDGGRTCTTQTLDHDFSFKSLSISASEYKNTSVADVDGDGLQDILFSSGSDLKYYHNQGGTFSSAKDITVNLPAEYDIDTSGRIYDNNFSDFSTSLKNSAMMDINGDGITDIILQVKKTIEKPDPCKHPDDASDPTISNTDTLSVSEDDSIERRCGPTTQVVIQTYAFTASVDNGVVSYTYQANLTSQIKTLRATDFNGDGLTDLAYVTIYENRWYYRLSKGNGQFTLPAPLIDINASDAAIYSRHQFIDLDNDGRADVLEATSGNTYNVHLSYNSSDSDSANFIERGSVHIGTASSANDTAVRFADMDGDAKIDLIYASSDSGSWSLHKADRALIKDHVLTKIINGFGVETQIAYAPINSGIALLNLESSQIPTIQASYDYDDDEDGRDFITPTAGIYTVSEVATQANDTESVLLQYAYGGPLAHTKGRGFLGFERVQTTDVQSGVITQNQYHQLFPLTGMPIRTTRLYQGLLLSSAENTYTQTTSSQGGIHVYLNQSIETSYALDLSSDGSTPNHHQQTSSSTTTNVHDNWNNLTSSQVDIKDAAGSLVHRTATTNSYSNNSYSVLNSEAVSLTHGHSQLDTQSGSQPDAKQFSRLYTSQVTKTRYQDTASGGSESQNRSTHFSYYANGMLRESLVNGLSSSYFYDKYGNKIAEQTTGKVNALDTQQRGQYWYYGGRGQYVAYQMNQNGEKEHYLINGQSATGTITGKIYSKTNTGPNKLASTQYFDIQGDAVKHILADGNESSSSQSLCSSCDKNFITVTNSATNKPTTQVYIDKYGREREQRSQSFDGQYVVTEMHYDTLGRVTQTSVPSFNIASSIVNSQTYDALGRVYQQTSPSESGSTSVSTQINGLKTTTTDEAGFQYIDEYSSDGQLIRRTDPQGQTIEYFYDAYGNSTQVTTKANNAADTLTSQSIRTQFDRYGRKTATQDPDKGSWTYDYNDFGELISQTDAKGQATTMAFDDMGRMTWRLDDTHFACWYYGNSVSSHNVGKAIGVKQWDSSQNSSNCASSAAANDSESYHYDDFGRPSQTDFIVSGNSYSTSNEYNSLGQVSRQYYPSNNGNFYVNFYYNSRHFLYLQTDSSGRRLREIQTIDALGNITEQAFANGTVENRNFNGRTGRISSIDVKKGSQTIHQLSYGLFDAKGNVESRSHSYYDQAGSLSVAFSEGFTYDSLNRIDTRSLSIGSGTLDPYGFDEQYQYDGFGNMLSRTGMINSAPVTALASYQYSSTSVNRLSNAAVDGKSYSTFSYDSNGNITHDGSRSFSYTAFDKASQISSGLQYTNYRYNHNRSVVQRSDYRQHDEQWKLFETDYVAGLYQQQRRYLDTDKTQLEHTQHKYLIGSIIVTRDQSATDNNDLESVQYQHSDHQGSILSITDDNGSVTQQYFYTAFGKPMQLSGNSLIAAKLPMTRGYTGHEMLPELDIIQMGGRIYDPNLGRFLQADPNIQAPKNLQNYNRYSYVLNNPLTYTDPSGYIFSTKWGLGRKIFNEVSAPVLQSLAKQPVLNAVVQIVGCVYSGPACPMFLAIYNGAQTQAVTGSMNAALKASAITYATSSAMAGANAYLDGIYRVLTIAAIGGVSAELQGGNFGDGFVKAGLGAAVAGGVDTGNSYANVAIDAVIGGTMSRITGGKFANGAITAAFTSIIRNDWSENSNSITTSSSSSISIFTKEGSQITLNTSGLTESDFIRTQGQLADLRSDGSISQDSLTKAMLQLSNAAAQHSIHLPDVGAARMNILGHHNQTQVAKIAAAVTLPLVSVGTIGVATTFNAYGIFSYAHAATNILSGNGSYGDAMTIGFYGYGKYMAKMTNNSIGMDIFNTVKSEVVTCAAQQGYICGN